MASYPPSGVRCYRCRMGSLSYFPCLQPGVSSISTSFGQHWQTGQGFIITVSGGFDCHLIIQIDGNKSPITQFIYFVAVRLLHPSRAPWVVANLTWKSKCRGPQTCSRCFGILCTLSNSNAQIKRGHLWDETCLYMIDFGTCWSLRYRGDGNHLQLNLTYLSALESAWKDNQRISTGRKSTGNLWINPSREKRSWTPDANPSNLCPFCQKAEFCWVSTRAINHNG